MIYRLTYCNKDGVEARVDIQKGLATPVIHIEGTERPFILSYNNDKGDKSGMFLSSSADIEIYETIDFNINNLKTSNETELTVTHYIDNVVSWRGFIIPDFFSIEVRNNPVITMTASDRLGTLKNVTLSDLPSMISLRELAILCLNKTGLTLPLRTMADFSNDGTNNAFFSYYIDSQRIKDIKGRSISCYDILSSILVASNSKLVQRAGEWVIINKLQHEIGSGKIYSSLSSFTNYLENIYNFDEVSIGARRTIMPVAGSVGIYHEHGGRKSHPANYDYSLGLSGWNSVNGFVATIENRHITFFLGGTPFFDPERTVKQYLLNYNNWIDDTNNLNTAPYITTDPIQINSPRADRVEVTVDISSIMAEKLSSYTAISFLRYAVILTNGIKTYTLTKAGIFEILDPENILGHSLLLRGGQQPPLLLASPSFSNSDSFKGLFEVGENDNVNDYSASIRVYGSGNQYVTVNYALIKFSDVSELPKGTMYKTEQGEVFTKAYDIETSIFGDYLLSGLDGYFYRYPNDDTSSIYKDVNTLSTPIWTTPSIPGETSELPILHHSTRQMRRMFSVAHDLLSAEIEVNNFDPLAIFVACGKRHTVVSAQFDFFKSNLSVELEEVAFQNATVRDFIYSYFGDGESGIKSIGGISGGGGGGGTGGGLTPEQIEILSWWKKDPNNPNTIFTEMNAYSKLELSAYGLGSGSGGGGGTTVSWGTESNSFIPLTVEGISKTVALLGHTHTKAEVGLSNVDNTSDLSKPISTATQIALNNKLETSIFNTHNNDNIRHITSAERVKWDKAYSDIEGLEIGGRNLFLQTQSFTGTMWSRLWSIDGVWNGFTVRKRNGDWYGTAQLVDVKKDDIYTFSCFIKIDESENKRLLIYSRYGTSLQNGGATVIYTNENEILGADSGVWHRLVVVYRINADNKWTPQVEGYGDSSAYIYIAGFKLEKGNKATDWTPAPEDQVSDWNTTDINSFSFIKNKPTLLSQFTDNIGVATHIANKANPHSVTKAQVGLGSVNNTSDLNKPISTAMQTALNLKANLASPTFTGVVTAPTFSGALSGNATSADNLNRSIIAGNGLSGGGVLNADRTITLGTPSNIDAKTTNSVSASSHTHALTSSTVNFTSLTDMSNTLNGMVSGSVGGPLGTSTVIGVWTTLASNTNYGAGFFTRYGRAFTLARENNVIGEWQELAYLTSTVESANNLNRSIIAGNGLSGGGVMTADRTITLGTPSNITVSTGNSVTATSHTHSLNLGGTSSQYLNGTTGLVTIPSITAGSGLTGGGQLTADRTFALGTPSTLTASTSNGLTSTSHTHAITTTSVGLANTIVQTDANGGVRGEVIRIGANWTLELIGTELQVKYNGVLKQRFLSDGSFVATGEVTAYE